MAATIFYLYFFIRVYLFVRAGARERGRKGVGEAGTPWSKEPDVGGQSQDPGMMMTGRSLID